MNEISEPNEMNAVDGVDDDGRGGERWILDSGDWIADWIGYLLDIGLDLGSSTSSFSFS